MGGTIFIVGTIVGYFIGAYVGNNPPTISGLMVLWLMVGFGVVGFIDDYLKVRSQRSLGLSGWRKVIGQVIVVVPFAVVGLSFPNLAGTTPASPLSSRLDCRPRRTIRAPSGSIAARPMIYVF